MVTAADLALPAGSTVTDAQATLALGVVEAFCGWSLEAGTFTVTLDSDGGTVLALPSLYVTGVSALTFNGVDRNGNPWPTLTPTVDWDWRANGILSRIGNVWPVGGGLLSVTYAGGYSPLPPVVLAVTATVAQRLAADITIQSHLENVGGIQSNTTYSQAVTAGAGLTAVEQSALGRYRMSVVA